MSLLRAATLITPDPDAAAALYGRWLDYAVVEGGRVPADLAASWGAPASVGRSYVVCQPASGREVFIRFVEGDIPAGYRGLTTHGWAAIEICVQDVAAVAAQLKDSPFEIIGPPAPLDGMPTIVAMQVKGPDDEIVFLTQISETPGFRLPQAESFIDRLFILVLACSDMAASGRWLAEALRLEMGPPIELAYGVLSDAFGLPADYKHTIATLTHGGEVFLEIDQYPEAATPRPTRDGELPPGVAMTTLKHPDFDRLTGPWVTEPVAREGAIYGGARVGVMRGPDGVLVEVVEG
jgi:hypothetical protein